MSCLKVLLELNPEKGTQTNSACRTLPRRAVQQASPRERWEECSNQSITHSVSNFFDSISWRVYFGNCGTLKKPSSIPVVSIVYLSWPEEDCLDGIGQGVWQWIESMDGRKRLSWQNHGKTSKLDSRQKIANKYFLAELILEEDLCRAWQWMWSHIQFQKGQRVSEISLRDTVGRQVTDVVF